VTVRHDGLTVDWLGYATARVAGGSTVYTDPGRYGVLTGEWADRHGGASHPAGDAYDRRDGDVVLVTHDHHYDPDGVRRVAAPDATVVVYEGVDADRIDRDVESPEELPHEVRRVGYGDSLSVGDVTVEAVPAHNDPDGPNVDADGEPYHPEGFGCGFRFAVDGVACLWPGDSDALDAHAALDVSLLLPSISRNFTMDRHGAADLAERLDPDLVVPIHYNTFPDLASDSGAFAADVAGRAVPVALDESR
jgi:L-ascorbate metabolism protein UlaG (beta-lactamase superfamily)